LKRSAEFDLPLALLRETLAHADLLPPIYKKYRPLLADGLCYFLERLPAARLKRIFTEQARMAATASIAERVVALFHHVPTLHKLGQVVARDRRLDGGFRAWLQQLETFQSRISRAEIIRLLEREFKGWRKAGIELGAHALAEGSVAVAMPFVWHDGAPSWALQKGVFKLLKLGIEERLAEDLAIWPVLGGFLDESCQHYHLPQLDYNETFEVVRDLLVHEVHLDDEQQRLAQAAKEFEMMTTVHIPALLPFNTPRLTAMEQLEGVTVTEDLKQKRPDGLALAPVIAEALIARPLFSPRPQALFHADPHAGNLFVTSQGRLGILDWSLAGELEKCDRIELVQLLLGALTLDPMRMERAVDALAREPGNRTVLREVLNRALRQLRWGTRPGIGWLTRLLDQIVIEARVRLKPEFLLFRKSLLTLEGVLADLTRSGERTGDIVIDQTLVSLLLGQLLIEWPERLQRPLDVRIFGTHLSTADLMSLFWSGPGSFARYWTGLLRDAEYRRFNPSKEA